jgi:hypothetical protein
MFGTTSLQQHNPWNFHDLLAQIFGIISIDIDRLQQYNNVEIALHKSHVKLNAFALRNGINRSPWGLRLRARGSIAGCADTKQRRIRLPTFAIGKTTPRGSNY